MENIVTQILDWIQHLGAWGAISFIFVYIAATILFIPGSLLTLGAGVLFGVGFGSIYVSIASTIGATVAFLIGRYLARKWIAKKIENNSKFKAIDAAIGKEGWKIVGLLRLSPVFPFNLLNYSLGITKVSLKDYFLASWIGMMPATIMYVYIGSLAGNIAILGAGGDRQTTSLQWIIRIVGFISTFAVTVYVTKIAKVALNSQIENQSEL